MKKFLLSFLPLLSLGCFAPAASAKPYHLTPISWIVATRDNLDKDDRFVTIVGHVTRRIASDEYWFTDGTGSVRLDSENFDLPVGPRLMVGGRIDQAWLGIGHLEVDVQRWKYAPLRRLATSRPARVYVPTRAAAPATVSTTHTASTMQTSGTPSNSGPTAPPLAPPAESH